MRGLQSRTAAALAALAVVGLSTWGLSVRSAAAQNAVRRPAATVSGVVVDATHTPMPRVAVTFEDEARPVTHRAMTDGYGRFSAVGIPLGTYIVDVTARGFTPFSGRLELAGPFDGVEIVLQPAEVTENITVSADDDAEGGDVRTRGPVEACEVPVDPDTQAPVGGQLQRPRMLSHPRPQFPEYLRDTEIDGLVRLQGRIGVDGTLTDLQVLEGAHPDFALAAEDAVRQWTWEEALLNCEPIEIGVQISVRFEP